MKRIEGLRKAEEIANIIKNYAPFLNEKGLNWYSGKDKQMKIFEIILFGSITRKCDDEFVDDIDILVIDNEVYSSECIYVGEEDNYSFLRDNFPEFIINHLGKGRLMLQYGREVLNDLVHETDVDMHVLPLKFFKNRKFREEIKAGHHDPNFFKNVFATAMRWRRGKQFVPVDVSYFERKYKVRLQDLKK